MDSKEAQAQLQQSYDLIKSLADTAQQHKAMLPVGKGSEVKPDKLPVMAQYGGLLKSLVNTDARSAAGGMVVQDQPMAALGNTLDVFDEQFVLQDIEGVALADMPYKITADDGQVFKGVTDHKGLTQRIKTKAQASLKIQADTDALKNQEPA
jgi:uncharacterized protein (DUF2345 family)